MSGIVREENKKERQKGCAPLCGKVHSAENAACGKLKLLLKLRQQEHSMEKNLANSMENAKLEPEVLRAVLLSMSDMVKNRQIFLDSLKRSLREMTEETRLVNSIVDSPESIRNLDTDAYRQRLVRLSRKIQDFKESCQLRTLSQERTALESELREFESNLHKYESATGNVGRPTTSAAASRGVENKRRHGDYKEIQDFHALIARTGHTDNWSDEDHLLFVKLRNKCGNVPALVTALRVKCPDLTAETIVNHEAWYKIYLDLREKQRSTIREWRRRKDETDRARKTREEEMDNTSEKAPPRERANSNNGANKISHVTDEREKSVKKPENVIDNGANRKKELIRQWRAEKESKRWMDEEQSRILAESKLAAQEKRKKERLKRIQEALAQYREKKSVERSDKISKSVPRPTYNPTLITAFRKQDEEYTNKRKNLIERLQKSAKNRATKIARSQVARKRDFSTLLNSTKVWTERCKMQRERGTREPKNLQYIKDVPRLYVQWRNQESTEIKDALTFS